VISVASNVHPPMRRCAVRNINWQVTDLCNLACQYCFSEERYVEGATLELGKQVATWLLGPASRGAQSVHLGFFGGEPLIRWSLIRDLMPIAEGMALRAKKRISFGMVTNGTLASRDVVETLRRHRFSVTLSIDGAPDIHDLHRIDKSGRGTWLRLKRNMGRLLEAFPRTWMRMTVTPESCGHLLRGVRHIVDDLGGYLVSAHPVLEGNWSDSQIKRYEHECMDVAEFMFARVSSGRPFYYEVLQRYASALLRGERRRYPCGVHRSFLGVDPVGNVYSCHRFISYGRFDERFRLGTVFQAEVGQGDSPFNLYSVERMRGCGHNCDSCEAVVVCGGGCPAVFYKVSGSIYHAVPAYQPLLIAEKRAAVRLLELACKSTDAFARAWFEKSLGGRLPNAL
jgi:uncharacterized protein